MIPDEEEPPEEQTPEPEEETPPPAPRAVRQTYREGPTTIAMILGGTDEPHVLQWMRTETPHRRQGHARSTLQLLAADADADGARLICRVENTEVGITAEGVAALLEGVGFVHSDGLWVREPST